MTENDDGMLAQFGDNNIASEMIGQDDDIRKLFLTLSNFCDTQEAKDYAWCIHKCRSCELPDFEEMFILMINALPSIKGWRSTQVVDMVTGIQIANDRHAESLKREKAQKENK